MIGDLQVFLQSTDGALEVNDLSKSPAGSGVSLETVPRKLNSRPSACSELSLPPPVPIWQSPKHAANQMTYDTPHSVLLEKEPDYGDEGSGLYFTQLE